MSQLTLVRRPRNQPATPGQEERARYVPRLRGPGEQLDFQVDGELLSERLRDLEVPHPETFGLDAFDFLSVADLVWPEAAASALRQLSGDEPRSPYWPLAPGRLPLYVCPMCADLGCGAITIEVVRSENSVLWRDFRVEDGIERDEERIDLSAMGALSFSPDEYHAALTKPLPMLDALSFEEVAAKDAWKQSHGPRRWLRRWTRHH